MPRKSKTAKAAEPVDLNPDAQLKAMYEVSKRMKGFRPAKEVLTRVRSHPTIFPLYDRATHIGGHPLERITLVHGPSSHGKTAFVHGLGLSFLKANNFYAFVDAEYTTPEEWLQAMMAQHADHPGFLASRPTSYEETVDAVRNAVNVIAEARKSGELSPDTTGLIVIDSIRKLVPRNLLAKILKGAEKSGMDGASGRGAMMKAALNAQWLDELVPLLYHTKCAMVIISREYDHEVDLSKIHEPGGGNEYKVAGGKALIFESSIVARVTRSWVKDGTGPDAVIVGERHQVEITKTKVSGKLGKTSKGWFHTSNGVLVPQGFDRARDVLELAVDAGKVTQAGSWLQCPVLNTKWQGFSKAVQALTADQFLLDTLEGEAR